MTEEEFRVAHQSLRTAGDVLEKNLLVHEDGTIAEGAFTMLLVAMKDALTILAKNGARLSFIDDAAAGKDVTDEIYHMRNAICHIGSAHRYAAPGFSMSFGRALGRVNITEIDGVIIGNPYEDDVAFFYGKLRLLLRRQIARAHLEATASLKKIADDNGWWFY